MSSGTCSTPPDHTGKLVLLLQLTLSSPLQCFLLETNNSFVTLIKSIKLSLDIQGQLCGGGGSSSRWQPEWWKDEEQLSAGLSREFAVVVVTFLIGSVASSSERTRTRRGASQPLLNNAVRMMVFLNKHAIKSILRLLSFVCN